MLEKLALQMLFMNREEYPACLLDLKDKQSVCLLFIYLELFFCSRYQSK